MKQKLLFLFFSILISGSVCAQTVGQIDDFEDGTTQGWVVGLFGATPPNPPTNEPTGGPAGVDDNFLKYASTGTSGAGSKMIIQNVDSRWLGDFTTAGVVRIKMDVRVTGADLDLRITLLGNAHRISTANAVTVNAGTGWTSIIIPISASDMVSVQGGNTTDVVNALASVTEMRILSSPTPSWQGETIAATLDVDNIMAMAVLSTKDNKLANAFSISPNPGNDRLNLKLSKLNSNATVEVFDVLGKKIYVDKVNAITKTVNVSQWNNGVYLVRLTTDSGTQTKRFVKQ